MTSSRLIDLDDGRALGPAVAGAKATALARARQAGLPVLPGFVVPVAESAAAMSVGLDTLGERGSGGARLAVSAMPVDDLLAEELLARSLPLGRRLVVRSSATVESGPAWAGAFASYAEISPEEVARAVRGCWASVFGPDALGRARSAGIGPGEVGMAVLVQRELEPAYGGVATLEEGGAVRIVGIAGPPAAIVSGWERGHVAVCPPAGRPAGDESIARLGADRLSRVADLTRRTGEVTGGSLIEWAFEGEDLWLLQAGVAARRASPKRTAPDLTPIPGLAALADVIARYPGSLGETLVLSWAVGLERLPEPVAPSAPMEAIEILEEARRLSVELTAQRWGRPPSAALRSAGEALGALRRTDPSETLGALAKLRPVDDETASRLLGLLDALGERLAGDGRLPAAQSIRYLGPAAVDRIGQPGARLLEPYRPIGVGRWEQLLHGAVAALGTRLSGEPVVSGSGAGLLCLVRDADDAEAFPPRGVVAARYPLNNLAPLLWDAAGLVTVGGSPGAHLFEVAGALGVPAVCGVGLEDASSAGLAGLHMRRDIAAAVDGATGEVHLLELGR